MHAPRNKFVIVLMLALACGLVAFDIPAASADEDYSNRIGVSLGGGFGKYMGGNLDHSKLGPYVQGGLRLGFRRKLDLEGTLRYGSFDAVELPLIPDPEAFPNAVSLKFRNQTTSFDLGMSYSLNPGAGWTPQAYFGLGLLFWQVVDYTFEPSSGPFADGPVARGFKEDGYAEFLTNTNFNLFVGLGAEFRLLEKASLRVGGRIDWLPKQETDNTGASAAFGNDEINRAHVDANDYFPTLFVSLNYFLSSRDADQDGIRDKDDACPYEAEDLDGYQDGDGCPDPDNDGDGVPDTNDSCPDEAEDMDGFEDDDGCPDPDNDADGILDAQDPCPNDAEDADGFEDTDGCPDPDNDGDGVMDESDSCDGTPQGVSVDASGCPTAARIDSATVLQGVRFVPNEPELAPASFEALDQVLESLRAYPDLEYEVQGHTSDLGGADQNLLLSQRRAEVVVQYFVERGIAARRLTPIGYGEEQPMVPNDSPENRATNERIVLVPAAGMQLESMDIEIETPKRDDNQNDD